MLQSTKLVSLSRPPGIATLDRARRRIRYISPCQHFPSPYGSIEECEIDPTIERADQEACDLEIARDKPAWVRLGGGEIWDKTLRAVSALMV